MAQQNWSNTTQDKPPVSWDGKAKTFHIVLSGLKDLGSDSLEAEWKPPITYVVRIREANGGDWSFGFETPLTSCGFVGLKPDTEYELQVRSKNSQGEREPALIKGRTNPDGSMGM